MFLYTNYLLKLSLTSRCNISGVIRSYKEDFDIADSLAAEISLKEHLSTENHAENTFDLKRTLTKYLALKIMLTKYF